MPKTQPPRHGKHTGPGSAGRRRWRLTFLVAGALAVAAIPTAWVMTRSPAPATHHEALNTGLRPTAQTEEVSLWTPEVKIKPRSFTEDTPVELGTRFTADHDGWVSGIRFFKASGEKGGHSGSLWDADGHRLRRHHRRLPRPARAVLPGGPRSRSPTRPPRAGRRPASPSPRASPKASSTPSRSTARAGTSARSAPKEHGRGHCRRSGGPASTPTARAASRGTGIPRTTTTTSTRSTSGGTPCPAPRRTRRPRP